MNVDDAVNKAMEQASKTPETKVEDKVVDSSKAPQINEPTAVEEKETAEQTESVSSDSEKKTVPDVWDGNPNTLPEFMQEHGKKVQRFVTQRTTEAAEQRKALERKVQEYEATLNGEEIKNFRSWQNQQKANPPTPVENAIDNGSITQQEWEDALLDLTGAKASALIGRTIKAEVGRAREEAMKEMQQEKQRETSVKSWENRIAEFSEIHPDFLEFHKMGLMKPVLQEVLANGGTLEDAYEKVKLMVDSVRGTERNKLNTEVDEKKALSSVDKTPKVKSDVQWVDSADEVMDRIISSAMDKKPIPKFKVRIKK